MAAVNIQNWKKMDAKARKGVKTRAVKLIRERVTFILDEAVRISPQWSGNYAANWTIATNKGGAGAYSTTLKVDPWNKLKWWDVASGADYDEMKSDFINSNGPMAKSAGAPEAIAKNKTREHEYIIDNVTWNTNIRLVNYTPIADEIEAGTLNLRNVNMVHGKIGVLAYLKGRYPNIIS